MFELFGSKTLSNNVFSFPESISQVYFQKLVDNNISFLIVERENPEEDDVKEVEVLISKSLHFQIL
jgi:hypothetical protein